MLLGRSGGKALLRQDNLFAGLYGMLEMDKPAAKRTGQAGRPSGDGPHNCCRHDRAVAQLGDHDEPESDATVSESAAELQSDHGEEHMLAKIASELGRPRISYEFACNTFWEIASGDGGSKH